MIDSLRQVINSKDVDTKIRHRAYRRILLKLVNIQTDSAHFYLSQYKKEVKSLKSKRDLATVYFYENKLFLYEGKYKEAGIAAKKALNIGIALKNLRVTANAYSDLGNSFQEAGELDSALYYYQMGLEQASKGKNTTATVRSMINIAETFKLKGQYIEALGHAQDALSIYKKSRETGFLPTLYGLLGSIYLEVENFDKAKGYLEQAIIEAQKRNNIKRLANSYELLAKCQLKIYDFAAAEENLLKSIQLGQETQIFEIEGRGLWKLAELYLIQKKTEKALEIILKSEEILTRTNSPLDLNNSLRVKGAIYNSIEDYAKAKNACIAAQKINKETGQKDSQVDICYCLYEAYSGLNKHQTANQYLRRYTILKDSLLNFAIARKITEIEYQKIFDSQILEDSIATINKLAKQKLGYEQEAAEQKRVLTISVAVAIVSLILIVFLSVIYSINKKKQAALEEKNLLINEQKTKIEDSLGEKEVLLKEIHHRVKNNLQIISGLLHLQSKGIEDEHVGAALNEGQTRIKSMALIHQKLYQTDNLAEVDLYEYVKDLGNYLLGMYPLGEEVDLDVDIDNIKLDIDTAIPLGLIINEAMTNALKYAFIDKIEPQIYLQIIPLQESGHYQLTFKDNGKGLPDNFNIRKTKSLGFKLIKRLSQQLLGKLRLENDNGLSINISFLDTNTRNETA